MAQQSCCWALLAAALLAGCGSSGGVCGPPAGAAGWMAYESRETGTTQLVLAALDGSCQVDLTTGDEASYAPSWIAATRTVVYAGYRQGALRLIVRPLGKAERLLDLGELSGGNPAVSPDGTTIAFEGRVGTGVVGLYTVPLAGGTPTPLAVSADVNAGPAWAPDGSAVYLVSNRAPEGGGTAGTYRVWRVNADGTGVTQISTTPGAPGAVLGRPAVSPDGGTLAFTRGNSGGSRVVLEDLATKAETVLAPFEDAEPFFDPAGGRLAVMTFEYGNPDVVLRALPDGAELQRVTDLASAQGAPSFPR